MTNPTSSLADLTLFATDIGETPLLETEEAKREWHEYVQSIVKNKCEQDGMQFFFYLKEVKGRTIIYWTEEMLKAGVSIKDIIKETL